VVRKVEKLKDYNWHSDLAYMTCLISMTYSSPGIAEDSTHISSNGLVWETQRRKLIFVKHCRLLKKQIDCLPCSVTAK